MISMTAVVVASVRDRFPTEADRVEILRGAALVSMRASNRVRYRTPDCPHRTWRRCRRPRVGHAGLLVEARDRVGGLHTEIGVRGQER